MLLKTTYLMLISIPQVYILNSITRSILTLVSDIGEGGGALLCKTDLVECCRSPPNRFGEFYYPNGTKVPIMALGDAFYRNRGLQEVRLNRRAGTTSPTGSFRCEVLDATRFVHSIYITLI